MSDTTATYKQPLIIAVSLHTALFILLFFQFTSHDFKQRNIQPDVDIIKAVAISQQTLDNIQTEKLRQQQEIEKRQAELKRRQVEKEMAAKKAADAKAAQEKAAKEAELRRKQADAKKAADAKAATEKAAKEKTAKLAAEKKAAKEKAAKLAAQQKAADELKEAQEKELQNQITKEQQAIEAARNKALQSEEDRYLALIQRTLENNWNIPANADPSIYTILHVQLAPGGVVLNVSVARSSGNPGFDNSARNAAFRASPLPVPENPDLFNRFRNITLQAGPASAMGR